jgi:hypothetical protein
MKKKITRTRTPEHNMKIGKSVAKTWDNEKREKLSQRMKLIWIKLKENNNENKPK